METTIVYWGCIGIMENAMEAAIMGYMVVGFLIVFRVIYPQPDSNFSQWPHMNISEKRVPLNHTRQQI